MGKHYIGEFEEIVLLTVAVLNGKAYGLAIIEDLETRQNRSVSIGAIQTVLRRMEDKGYLSSAFGEATKARGGKRKRFFSITAAGYKALESKKDARLSLWDSIPNLSFNTQP